MSPSNFGHHRARHHRFPRLVIVGERPTRQRQTHIRNLDYPRSHTAAPVHPIMLHLRLDRYATRKAETIGRLPLMGAKARSRSQLKKGRLPHFRLNRRLSGLSNKPAISPPSTAPQKFPNDLSAHLCHLRCANLLKFLLVFAQSATQ
jgi:hypothetical protein